MYVEEKKKVYFCHLNWSFSNDPLSSEYTLYEFLYRFNSLKVKARTWESDYEEDPEPSSEEEDEEDLDEEAKERKKAKLAAASKDIILSSLFLVIIISLFGKNCSLDQNVTLIWN